MKKKSLGGYNKSCVDSFFIFKVSNTLLLWIVSQVLKTLAVQQINYVYKNVFLTKKDVLIKQVLFFLYNIARSLVINVCE